MSKLQNQNVFGNIYKSHVWRGNSRSGPGSDTRNCSQYTDYLQKFVDANRDVIKTVIDVGCGDWAISRNISWGNVEYLGVDVVPELIDDLNRIYKKQNIDFACIDLTCEELPAADLIIVKDVLQHLKNESVLTFLRQLKKYKLALLTNDCNRYHQPYWPFPWGTKEVGIVNSDISNGDWRPIQLRERPFNLKAEQIMCFEYNLAKRTIDKKQVLLWGNYCQLSN